MGQTLMLHRAAYFLRVTEAGGKFDALDQPADEPMPGEKLYAYVVMEMPLLCHIRASGGRGGMYPMATYRLCDPQPPDATMRDNATWRKWAESQPLPQI